MELVGYKNSKLVDELCAQGKLEKAWGNGRTFDPMQYALLKKLAEATYDYPLDKKVKNPNAVPRTYTYGWLAMAVEFGMTYPQSPDEIEVIGGEPRAPQREKQAVKRISETAKRLADAGFIKCLRKESVQKKNNAIWLLTIGTPEENAEVEAYVRSKLRL